MLFWSYLLTLYFIHKFLLTSSFQLSNCFKNPKNFLVQLLAGSVALTWLPHNHCNMCCLFWIVSGLFSVYFPCVFLCVLFLFATIQYMFFLSIPYFSTFQSISILFHVVYSILFISISFHPSRQISFAFLFPIFSCISYVPI